VVQRTYYKPYGEEAWNLNNSRLTTVGYTGQRLDTDSGLMFYGARFYDPILSHFISADSIASSKGDLKTRNRYSYALNNPQKYTDPTGHCADDKDVEDARACNRAVEHLRKFGFTVDPNHWTLLQLQWMIDAINDILRHMRKGAFAYQTFRDLLGIGEGEVAIINMDIPGQVLSSFRDTACGPMCTDGKSLWISPDLVDDLYADQGGLPNNPEEFYRFFKYAFVHELAHIIDLRHDNIHYKAIEKIRKCGPLWACSGEPAVSERGGQAKCGALGTCQPGHGEDWAETVAAEVYPGYKLGIYGSRDPNNAPEHRAYARCVLGLGVGPCRLSSPPPPIGGPVGPRPPCWNVNGCN
jgi:RHS repeat-associated protein